MSKTFNNSVIKVRNADGEFEGLAALRGLDSYELAKANGFTGTEEEWMNSIIGDGWVGAYQALEAEVTALKQQNTRLVYSDIIIPAGSFVLDETDIYYPYRATIPIQECTSTMIADVLFSSIDVNSGVFSPISDTFDGGVYIYSWRDPGEPITIPAIYLWR